MKTPLAKLEDTLRKSLGSNANVVQYTYPESFSIHCRDDSSNIHCHDSSSIHCRDFSSTHCQVVRRWAKLMGITMNHDKTTPQTIVVMVLLGVQLEVYNIRMGIAPRPNKERVKWLSMRLHAMRKDGIMESA